MKSIKTKAGTKPITVRSSVTWAVIYQTLSLTFSACVKKPVKQQKRGN